CSFSVTLPPSLYPPSLHDALPIYLGLAPTPALSLGVLVQSHRRISFAAHRLGADHDDIGDLPHPTEQILIGSRRQRADASVDGRRAVETGHHVPGHPAFVSRPSAVDLKIGRQRVRDRCTAFESLHLGSLLNHSTRHR